jgi:predicted MFS family arabinose efflux permease
VAPLVFMGGFAAALLGVIGWGIGIGAQDTLLKAVLVKIIGREKRATAFGVFDTAFGIAWFAGSATMGLLYDHSITTLVVFSVVLQLAALPVMLLA